MNIENPMVMPLFKFLVFTQSIKWSICKEYSLPLHWITCCNKAVRYGLIEEAIYSIRKKQPLYLCGTFGGATKGVIDAIVSGNSPGLTLNFQFKNDLYKDFYNHWNSTETDKIDNPEMVKEFSNYGIKELSLNNGLNEDENMRLFNTPHIHEMSYLILKGLKIKKLM